MQKKVVTADVCIVGGGVIGLLSARECLIAGASVCIVDAGECGKESSWAGGGIVSPLYPWRYDASVTALATWAQHIYPTLCAELFESTAIDCEWQKSGLLILAVSDRADALAWCTKTQRNITELSQSNAISLQAGLRVDSNDSLYFPDVAQVRNPRLMKALKADLLRRGALIYEHTSINHINHNQRRVTSVQSAAQDFSAQQFVICSGAWSASVLKEVNAELDVKPIRGQMLMFEPHAHCLQRIVLKNGRYLIPRLDGRILCGSTVEDVGFDKSTTNEAKDSLLQSAIDIMPSLTESKIEMHWSGLRPGSVTGIPTISSVPQFENLFVNAGQFRNGVVLAPASARLLVDVMRQRMPIVDPSPYQIK